MAIIRGGPQRSMLDRSLEEGAGRTGPAPGTGPGEELRAPGSAAAAPPAEATAGATVGVIFVHGIGSQKPGEILDSWSAAIIRAVAGWADAEGDDRLVAPLRDRVGRRVDPVIQAQIDFDASTIEVVELAIPGLAGGGAAAASRAPQRWVLTEAWWASKVTPPSLTAVLDWSTRQGVLARVVDGILRGGASPNRPALQVLGRIGLSTFLSLASSVAMIAYLALRSVAAIVPIQALRDAAVFHAFDTFLVDWWGDLYQLLRDPAQAANVRGQIATAAQALAAYGCDRIVVVAHSGGTAAAYMALGDVAQPLGSAGAGGEADAEHATAPSAPVAKLITHGEAINLARSFPAGLYDDPAQGAAGQRPGTADRLEPGLPWTGRWVDFWATHDPAPHGRLVPEADARPDFESVVVWNRRSIREDHGAYFDNDEEFVLPLLRELDTPDDPAASRFPATSSEAVRARHQRVHLLTLWRRIGFVAPFAAILAVLAAGYPGSGMRDLVGAAGLAWTYVPGHDAAERLLATTGTWHLGWLLNAAGVVAILVLGAIVTGLAVHAALPIGQDDVWADTPPRRLIAGLDLLPAPLMIVLAIAIAWSLATNPDPRIRALLVLVVLAGLLVGALLVQGIDRERGRPLRVRRFAVTDRVPVALAEAGSFVLVLAAAIFLPLAIIGILAVEPIRTAVIGAALAFAVFRPIVGFGGWRWERWDAAERAAVRRRGERPRRRLVAAESVALLAVALLAAAGIVVGSIWIAGIGRVSLIAVAAVVLVVTAIATALADLERTGARA